MHAAITYRRVKKKDILEIINLFKTIFKKNISVEFYNWRYLTKNFYNSFVAIQNDKIIAHVGYVKYRYYKKKIIFSRHSSFVSFKFRRKKIYTKLLEYSFSILKKKTNFILAWPNELNLKNNINDKKFFLIQKYFLYRKIHKKIIKFDTVKLLKSSLSIINTKKNNSVFIKDNKYILWRFFSYKKNNFYQLTFKSIEKSLIILQKIKFKNKTLFNIADYFDNNNNKILEKLFIYFNKFQINSQILVPSNNKRFISKVMKYDFKKDNYIFNVGIYTLKKNDKLKKILINKIKNNIKIADTDVFIETI